MPFLSSLPTPAAVTGCFLPADFSFQPFTVSAFVCGMFPMWPSINVLMAMISLGLRSFGANMTFSWTDPCYGVEEVFHTD